MTKTMIIVNDLMITDLVFQAGTPRSVCMLSNTTAIQVDDDEHDIEVDHYHHHESENG